MSILSAKNLHFSYGEKKILNNFSCEVQKGERLCYLGASGCGKTTFLRICAGLEKPTSGEVILRGTKACGDNTFVHPSKRKVGFVFQNFALFEKISVQKNIEYGCQKPEDFDEAKKLIGLLSLESHLNKYPHQLSGGEKQKVALARSLALKPDVILLDEPFSSIDTDQTEYLIKEMTELFEKLKVTAVMVTHSKEEARQFATRVETFKGLC